MSQSLTQNPSEPSREEIGQALLSAFQSHAALAVMVQFKFGISLETISLDSNLPAVVSRLMIWADERGCLAELVTKAAEQVPGNQELREVAERFKQLQPQPVPKRPGRLAGRVNLLPVIGTRLKDEDLVATREFLFKGHPWLGRLFTMRPWKLAASFSILAILFLMLPSYLIGVHLLTRNGARVGFWQSYNRSALYLVGLPLLFAGTVWLSNYMRAVIETLANKQVKVITTQDGEEATDYEQALSDKLAKSARPLLIVCALLTLVVMVLDTYQIWNSYIRRYAGEGYSGEESDWRVAAIDPAFAVDSKQPVEPIWNLLFDIDVYLFAAAVIFLVLFWVAKFWLYLRFFSTSMEPDESPYRFNPLAYDPYKRLGLYPMGRLFNSFMLIVVGCLLYVLWRRLDLIRLHENGWQAIPGALNPFNLGKLAYHHFDAMTVGFMILLAFSVVPILIVSYFSLFTLRRYVMEQRERAFLEHGQELEEARRIGNHSRAKMLEEKINLLEDANVWPNGDITAKRFLFIMIALSCTALLPPLLLYFVALGLLLEVWRSITRHRPVRSS
jgi:Effector-associated domain 1